MWAIYDIVVPLVTRTVVAHTGAVRQIAEVRVTTDSEDIERLLRLMIADTLAPLCVSVLRPYLDRRRECTDLVSRQCFLNLFVLWFNMHKFERGPRKGKNPYELAGIDLGTDDWLSLLGYPSD